MLALARHAALNLMSEVMRMNRFSWNWKLSELKHDKDIKVFTTFSCGGGSSMGYKRCGFEVLGNVEIDPKINKMYCKNHHPKYNFNLDLREFNKLAELPEELYSIDILDGSPPCTTFSTAGKREKSWGKKKKFREGQAEQTLDDLFFVFLDTVEKLKPKVVIAENVVGLVKGNAKGYVNQIVQRFRELGYDVQLFSLNSAYMDVPQARHRVFFVANNQGYPKLKLSFNYDPIPFEKVRSEKGVPFKSDDALFNRLLQEAKVSDKTVGDIAERIVGEKNRYFTAMIMQDHLVAPTITANGQMMRFCDKMLMSKQDFVNVGSFPQDYDFCGNDPQYVTGMSVPPNMMANVAQEVYNQWLKQ